MRKTVMNGKGLAVALALGLSLVGSPGFAGLFDDLRAKLSPPTVKTAPVSSQPTPPKGGYSVPYTLEGVLAVQDGVATLNTVDGRIFSLVISTGKAREYAGKSVHIYGVAPQADNVRYIKVKKIKAVDLKAAKTVLAPYKQGQRSPVMLESSSDASIIQDFRWDLTSVASGSLKHGWVTATIKPDLVKNVYFIKKPFPPEWIAAHSLFLFTFEPGGVVDAKGRSTEGLFLSIEAFQREDQNYSLVKGVQNEFGAVWLLGSWDNYLRQSCQYQGEKLILYPVRLSDAQKVALVQETLEQATVNREGEYYHTITNNCTNNLVILLNHVLEKNKQVKMWTLPSMIYNFRATMPVWVPGMLMKKGIIGKPLPELNKTTWQKTWAKNPDTYLENQNP
jgi:hypothetical protein